MYVLKKTRSPEFNPRRLRIICSFPVLESTWCLGIFETNTENYVCRAQRTNSHERRSIHDIFNTLDILWRRCICALARL